MRHRLLALAAVSTVVLGACSSQPSARTLARDTVESLDGLTESERTCMIDVIEAMSKDEVEQLGRDNASEVITSAESGNADLQAFIADLAACRTAG